jgi:hypothetical protein
MTGAKAGYVLFLPVELATMSETKTLAELNVANREQAKVDPHMAFTTYPELFFPILLTPCTVRILMVLDGGGYFTDHDDFGLGELLKALSVSPGPWVRFAVTKAHRANPMGSGADIVNFRFDQHDLSQYDEIWLFALDAGGATLPDPEIRAIATFMNAGGGVFATGDHEDLGVVMCGRIPRVRSMRKWYYPNPGPHGEPVAPKVDGPTRNDVNVPRGGNDYFNNQSDDLPQIIRPRLYGPAGMQVPHPLFSGPRGVINVLPDHPHEGECYEPADLTAKLTFAGLTVEEYPERSPGHRVSPEIVAYSNNGPGIIDRFHPKDGSPTSKQYGAVGAYDGHLVDVGRVVVHSTWHHFFNINIHGALAPDYPDPVYKKGFYYSPQGLAAYEDIKSHYRNIAVYLAPSPIQACMRGRALWATRWDSGVVMALRNVAEVGPAATGADEVVRIGAIARAVLRAISSESQAWRWALDCLPPRALPLLDRSLGLSGSSAVDAAWLQIQSALSQLIIDAVIGSVTCQIAIDFARPTEDSRNKATRWDFDALIKGAADIGLTKSFEKLTHVGRALGGTLAGMDRQVTPVSFARDILPLFRPIDIDHMGQRGVHLDQYAYMSDPTGNATYSDHAHGREVYCYLTGECTPRMPPGGPYWTPEQLQLFEKWMSDGFKP